MYYVSMDINGRREEILRILGDREYVTVEEFSKVLGVSAVTIRTDLSALEESGFLIRTHGGAMKNSKKGEARLISNTLIENEEEKRALAEKAASLIRPGNTIIIDSGSTTIHLIEHLKGKNITVVTNNILALDKLKNEDDIKIVALGGSLRRESMGTVGPLAETAVKSMNVDIYFMGAAAYDRSNITSSDMNEAVLKRDMIEASDKVVFLADSSKFGKKAFSKICTWHDIDAFVSDKVDPDFRRELEEMGVEVLASDD